MRLSDDLAVVWEKVEQIEKLSLILDAIMDIESHELLHADRYEHIDTARLDYCQFTLEVYKQHLDMLLCQIRYTVSQAGRHTPSSVAGGKPIENAKPKGVLARN